MNGGGGRDRWLVVIFTPMFLHIPMQLDKVLTFYKVTSITKNINNQNKKKKIKSKIMHNNFLKRKKSVPQKNQ